MSLVFSRDMCYTDSSLKGEVALFNRNMKAFYCTMSGIFLSSLLLNVCKSFFKTPFRPLVGPEFFYFLSVYTPTSFPTYFLNYFDFFHKY